MSCDCIFHRYHVVHCLPGDPRVYDHSQGTWDDVLRSRDDVENYPSHTYIHGMSADELRAAAAGVPRMKASDLLTLIRMPQ
jgi:hypothetical protein